MLKKPTHILAILLGIACLTGCSSVSLQSSWKDTSTPSRQYRKILVVGISERPQMRQVFEEVFVAEARKRGITGIASYTLTGVAATPSRDSLEQAVKTSGADSVITTRLVGIKENRDTRSGFILTSHGATTISGIPVSYATFVHQPVEVTTSTNAAIETNLFNTETGIMTWSGITNAVNPEGIITIASEVANIVLNELVKGGLL